jgi:hypothetical protein
LLQTASIFVFLEFELLSALLARHDVFFNNHNNTAAANTDPNAVCYGLFFTREKILSVHFFASKK